MSVSLWNTERRKDTSTDRTLPQTPTKSPAMRHASAHLENEVSSEMLSLLPPEAVQVAQFRRGAGCAQCVGTGFSGRTALAESFEVRNFLGDSRLVPAEDFRGLDFSGRSSALGAALRTIAERCMVRAERGNSSPISTPGALVAANASDDDRRSVSAASAASVR